MLTYRYIQTEKLPSALHAIFIDIFSSLVLVFKFAWQQQMLNGDHSIHRTSCIILVQGYEAPAQSGNSGWKKKNQKTAILKVTNDGSRNFTSLAPILQCLSRGKDLGAVQKGWGWEYLKWGEREQSCKLYGFALAFAVIPRATYVTSFFTGSDIMPQLSHRLHCLPTLF